MMITSLPTAPHTISMERSVAAPATSEDGVVGNNGLDGGTGIYANLTNPPEGSYSQISTQGASESRFLSLTCLLALPQARLPGADYGLGPVGNLQLSEDVRDVVAYRLRT